jgi:hypothetical protein
MVPYFHPFFELDRGVMRVGQMTLGQRKGDDTVWQSGTG